MLRRSERNKATRYFSNFVLLQLLKGLLIIVLSRYKFGFEFFEKNIYCREPENQLAGNRNKFIYLSHVRRNNCHVCEVIKGIVLSEIN
jgi:hypothetical protein